MSFYYGANAQIIPPLYVGNIAPVLDQFKKPIKGSWSEPEQTRSLIEIRLANDGIIRPPNFDGISHYKNPLLRKSSCGLMAMGIDSGLFCEIFPRRIDTTNKIFARAYNGKTAEESTFYANTPVYDIPKQQESCIVLVFGDARPIDSRDSDGDGLNNSWEETFGTDDISTWDYDNDGMSDLNEMLAGTDLKNPLSKLVFNLLRMNDLRIIEVGWQSIPEKKYRLEGASSLKENFAAITDVITATESNTSVLVESEKSFFRVRLVQ